MLFQISAHFKINILELLSDIIRASVKYPLSSWYKMIEHMYFISLLFLFISGYLDLDRRFDQSTITVCITIPTLNIQIDMPK